MQNLRWQKLNLNLFPTLTCIYLFIKKRMRGSIFYIAKRFSKANKKYMKYYDDNKPRKYIMYSDLNKLMVGYLVNIFLTVNLNG